MKPCLSILCPGLLVLGLLTVPLAAVQAQDPAASAAPDTTAAPTPRPRPKPKLAPDASVPAGTINGVAIYRPLLKSIVADPLDRALVVADYNHRQPRLSQGQTDAAVRDYKHAKFNDNDAQLDAKLKDLGANRDDFREFVVEEAKLRLMLNNATRGALSDESAQRAQKAYIASLRQKARINQPKRP